MASDDDEKTKVTKHPDGSVTAESKNLRVEFDSDGTSKFYSDIKRVSLENLTDVVSYDLKSDDTATSHHVRFRGGGDLRFSYRADGRILELSGSHVKMSVDEEGLVTVGDSDKK